MKTNKKSEVKIGEFISESIEKIKSGMPKECVMNRNFDFEISVMTKKKTRGKLNIFLADIEHISNAHQIHKIRFSIIDKKSREENAQFTYKFLRNLTSEFSKLDQLNK